jgi:hypothetical protein
VIVVALSSTLALHWPSAGVAVVMEEQSNELDAALVESMRGLVSKPDLYLIKAAQAST